MENQKISYAEIVRGNARYLAQQAGGIAKFAEKLAMADTQASQIIGKNPVRNIGHRTARRIEEAFGKPTGWIDRIHDEDGLKAQLTDVLSDQTANELRVLQEQVARAAACLRAYEKADGADKETLVRLALSVLEED